jgi:putative transposase
VVAWGMRRSRWLAWPASREGSADKPAVYHCISRVVERRFAFGEAEREKFRTFMRMQELFSGCRVQAYCVMSNHFHILLEVPPRPEGGLTDEVLLERLAVTSPELVVDGVRQELAAARQAGDAERAAAIHARYTYRMHDLSEFMKALLIRFTRWFNRTHERRGTLWEERFKSVIVQSGLAARTMAAYIDLNPVRAGMVADPADYRWSSYGEAVGGGPKGDGKKAREGLVRACLSDDGAGFEAERWKQVSRAYRRTLGAALERRAGGAESVKRGRAAEENKARAARRRAEAIREGVAPEEPDNDTVLPDLGMAAMLRHRVRYFSDGAVIGSREFVNEAFAAARERFGPKRKRGACRLRGAGAPAAGRLFSARGLRVGV